MSDEDRQSAEQWLGALWGEYQREVTEARELAADALDQYAANLTEALEAAGGDLARVNLEAGLIDAIHNDETFTEYMQERFGDSGDGEYHKVGFANYLTVADRENPPYSDDENKVGVVVVSGSIIDGSAGPGAAAGDSIAKLVRHAAEEDDIKALVLQVDSPGGSAFASEVISGAVATVSEAGKPVVVSMSSVAASGGYYVAAEADEIWGLLGNHYRVDRCGRGVVYRAEAAGAHWIYRGRAGNHAAVGTGAYRRGHGRRPPPAGGRSDRQGI